MKKLVVVLALVVFSAVAAFADVQDFGAFTIDVADGWTASVDGETVGIVKDDNTCSMSITYDSADGVSLQELAEGFVQAFSATNLQENNGSYTFQMVNAGITSECYLFGEDGKYALVVITGRENAPDDVDAMMDSLHDKE